MYHEKVVLSKINEQTLCACAMKDVSTHTGSPIATILVVCRQCLYNSQWVILLYYTLQKGL